MIVCVFTWVPQKQTLRHRFECILVISRNTDELIRE